MTSKDTPSEIRLAGAVLFVVCAALFVIGTVLNGSALDVGLSRFLFDLGQTNSLLREGSSAATWLGSSLPGTTINAAVVLFLLIRKKWTPAMLLVVLPLTASRICELIKYVVARPRPQFLCEGYSDCVIAGYAMPSAHAVSAAVLYLLMIWVISLHRSSTATRVIMTLLLVIALSIGWSRVFLGFHFVTDVIVGQALGAIFVALVLLATRVRSGEPVKAFGMTIRARRNNEENS